MLGIAGHAPLTFRLYATGRAQRAAAQYRHWGAARGPGDVVQAQPGGGGPAAMREEDGGGGRPILVMADVADEQAVNAMFGRVTDEYGQVDILVNNVGGQFAGDSGELAAADFGEVLAVNLRGRSCALAGQCRASWPRVLPA